MRRLPYDSVYLRSSAQGLYRSMTAATCDGLEMENRALLRVAGGLSSQGRYLFDNGELRGKDPVMKHTRVGLCEVPRFTWYDRDGSLNSQSSTSRQWRSGYDLFNTLDQSVGSTRYITDSSIITPFHAYDGTKSNLSVLVTDACQSYCDLAGSKFGWVTGSDDDQSVFLVNPNSTNSLVAGAKKLRSRYTPSWIDPKPTCYSRTLGSAAPYMGSSGDSFEDHQALYYNPAIKMYPMSVAVPNTGDLPDWDGLSLRSHMKFIESVGYSAVSSRFNIWNAMRELPESLTAVVTILQFLKIFLRPTRLASMKNLKLLAETHLAFNFGVYPTLGDVESALNVLAKSYSTQLSIPVASKLWLTGPRHAEPTIRLNPYYIPDPVAYGGTFWTEGSVFTHSVPFSPPRYIDEKVSTEQELSLRSHWALLPREIVRVKAYVKAANYRKYLESANRISQSANRSLTAIAARREILGEGELDDFLYFVADTLWEMIPYSFIVDYFTNMSEVLQSYMQNQDQRLLDIGEYSVYRFSGLELVQSIITENDRYGKPYGSHIDNSILMSFVRARIGVREFTRWKGFFPYHPSLEVSFLSLRQALNLLALFGVKSIN